MENLTYIFNSTTRGQLVEFITAMTHAIEPDKTAISPLPFMISISGTANAGKSLFWDQIKDTRLNAPINDVARSREAENNGRIYETWSGTDKETAQSLSIFFCNTQAMYIMGEDHLGISAFRKAIATHSTLARKEKPLSSDEIAPFVCDDPRKFGDIILWSNEGMSVDISIRITSPYAMDLHRWSRKTALTINNPELKKSPKFQGFLNRYCEIA